MDWFYWSFQFLITFSLSKYQLLKIQVHFLLSDQIVTDSTSVFFILKSCLSLLFHQLSLSDLCVTRKIVVSMRTQRLRPSV